MENKNQTIKWINSLAGKFEIDKEIINQTIKRGIYGIFIINTNTATNDEYCAYVGRANNIYSRMFSSGEHFSKLRNHQEIKSLCEALDDETKKIEVRILEEVKYTYENYYLDTQLLASKENKYIDEYQAKGQCLEQLPDGKNIEYKVWLDEKEDSHKK